MFSTDLQRPKQVERRITRMAQTKTKCNDVTM